MGYKFRNMKKTSNVFLTVLITAAIGLVAGLLFAPNTGRRTRKRLMKKARKFNSNVQHFAKNSNATMKDVRESLIDFTDAAGHSFEKLLKKK
jgi:gas vesicle protein